MTYLDNLELEDQNLFKYDFINWKPEIKKIKMTVEEANMIMSIHEYLMKVSLENDDHPSDDKIISIIEKAEILKPLIETIDNFIKNNFTGLTGSVFIKMHRSPKDADWSSYYDFNHFRCNTGMDVLLLLVKSERINEDLKDYLDRGFPLYIYFQDFKLAKCNNEFRVYVHNKKIFGISQLPYSGDFLMDINDVVRLAKISVVPFLEQYPTFAMDFEIIDSNNYRVFEINPFDSSTDLYIFSKEEMEKLDGEEIAIKYNCIPTDDIMLCDNE